MFLLNLGNEFTPAKKEIFTSHYVPIKSILQNPQWTDERLFTSHYVPIKSMNLVKQSHVILQFTSHYVPIKSPMLCLILMLMLNLHPIMFLLNRMNEELKPCPF